MARKGQVITTTDKTIHTTRRSRDVGVCQTSTECGCEILSFSACRHGAQEGPAIANGRHIQGGVPSDGSELKGCVEDTAEIRRVDKGRLEIVSKTNRTHRIGTTDGGESGSTEASVAPGRKNAIWHHTNRAGAEGCAGIHLNLDTTTDDVCSTAVGVVRVIDQDTTES